MSVPSTEPSVFKSQVKYCFPFYPTFNADVYSCNKAKAMFNLVSCVFGNYPELVFISPTVDDFFSVWVLVRGQRFGSREANTDESGFLIMPCSCCVAVGHRAVSKRQCVFKKPLTTFYLPHTLTCQMWLFTTPAYLHIDLVISLMSHDLSLSLSSSQYFIHFCFKLFKNFFIFFFNHLFIFFLSSYRNCEIQLQNEPRCAGVW